MKKTVLALLLMLLGISVFGVEAASIKVRADIPVTPPGDMLKEACKDGGWKVFTSDPGPFKNQGQCVSHFVKMQHIAPTATPTP